MSRPPVARPATDPTADQFAGCLLGQALGDALGFVVEAEPPEAARAYAAEVLRPRRAPSRGRDPFPFGQYSDDTQLARELVRSWVHCAGFDPADYARRVAALVAEEGLVGGGPGSTSAAQRILAGTPWREAGAPPSYEGNGSAMRAGPLGLFFASRFGDLARAAAEQSLVTHRSPRCAAGAAAVAGAVALAARPGTHDRGGFVEALRALVEPVDRATAEALDLLPRLLALPPERAAAELFAARLDPSYPDRWLGVSAHVTLSVLWSLYAFLRSPDDYWEAVCTAIEVGGDTDTAAAIVGAIAGARLGPGALPARLLEPVTDRGRWGAAELDALAREAHAVGAAGGRGG